MTLTFLGLLTLSSSLQKVSRPLSSTCLFSSILAVKVGWISKTFSVCNRECLADESVPRPRSSKKNLQKKYKRYGNERPWFKKNMHGLSKTKEECTSVVACMLSVSTTVWTPIQSVKGTWVQLGVNDSLPFWLAELDIKHDQTNTEGRKEAGKDTRANTSTRLQWARDNNVKK